MAAPDLLPPPIPSDADLTDFRFMPLEVARLRRSRAWLICKRRPELAFYMINLWTAAWHERPAGSLEDDDDVLADAAMCSPEKWPEVRDDALRGWMKHADGRLYHPVVAEKVMDSWHGKLLARWKKECDRIRKENLRRKEKGMDPLDFPPEPTRASAPCPSDVQRDPAEAYGVPSETSALPLEKPASPAEGGGVPSEGVGNPAENALKGEGEERDSKGYSEANASGAKAPQGGDPKSQLFGPGVRWLMGKTGKSDPKCRSLMGKWRRDLGGDAELLDMLAQAQALDVLVPEEWFSAAIRERKKHPREGDPPPRTAAEVIAQRQADPLWAGVQ